MALTNCPECGSEVSNQAFICPKCGFPIRARAASGSTLMPNEQPLRSEKKHYGKIIILSLIIASLIIIALVYKNNSSLVNDWLFGGASASYNFSSQNSAPIYVPTQHTSYLIQGSIVARANEQYRHFEFSTVAGSSNNRVVGRFQAYGGSGNDIRIMIMTQDDYTNFINGHNVSTYYNSGVKTVGNLDVSLPPGHGSYDLVIDNYFSIVTDKEVQANIKLNSTY